MIDSNRDERGFWRREASWLQTRLVRLRNGITRLRVRLARLLGRRLR